MMFKLLSLDSHLKNSATPKVAHQRLLSLLFGAFFIVVIVCTIASLYSFSNDSHDRTASKITKVAPTLYFKDRPTMPYGVSIIKTWNESSGKGILVEPILPEHRAAARNLHVIVSTPKTGPRGNHQHPTADEALVLIRGRWLLRVKVPSQPFIAHDFVFDSKDTGPLSILVSRHVCHALMKIDKDERDAVAASYYLIPKAMGEAEQDESVPPAREMCPILQL